MAGANPLTIIQGLLEVEEKIGSFIKGDIGGDSAIANHFRDQYRARCEEFSNAPGWLQNFPGFKAAGTIGRICKPYLDDNEWDLPVPDAPFQGGQCEVEYTVVVQASAQRIFNSNTCESVADSGPRQVTVMGPIQSISFPQDASNPCNNGSPTERRRLLVVGSTSGLSSQYFNAPMVPGSFSPGAPQITRTDGQSDTCGDPDPVPTPGPNPAPMPDPIRLPGDEPRPNPRNPDGLPDIPVDPFPDPIGGPGFPALPDGFGFGGGKSGGGGAGRSFDPIENNDETGGQDEDFDDPPEGEVWVGAYLELTQVPGNITTVPGTGPENGAYFRIVGNFSIYSDSESSRLYSDSVQVRNRWTKFIGNPQGLPVSGARVRVLPGVRYKVIPVSAPADPDRNGEE